MNGLPVAFGGLSLLLLWGVLHLLRFKRLVENVPTSKVKGVCIGLTEVKGTAEPEGEPLRSYLAEADTVWWQYEITEEWERTVTTTDSKGNIHTHTESGWETVDRGERLQPFLVRDFTGALRVNPKSAHIEPVCIFSKTCSRGDPLYYGKGPPKTVSDSTHRRQFTEHAIPVGQRLYVLGTAAIRSDVVAAEIRRSGHGEPFLISCRDERKIVRSQAWGAGTLFVLALLLALAAPLVAGGPRGATFSAHLQLRASAVATAGAIFAGVGLLLYGWLLYNDLVRVRNRARNALSLIDVQLKRRADLIPNLVQVVQASAAHEQQTQELLARARSVAHRSTRSARQLGRTMSSTKEIVRGFAALFESYPHLKADANFKALFDALRDTEDRIALAAGFYNACLAALRNRLQTFPDVVVATLTAFRAGPDLPV